MNIKELELLIYTFKNATLKDLKKIKNIELVITSIKNLNL